MAGEVQLSFATGQTLGYIIRDQNARPWNTSGAGAFDAVYLTANYGSYVIAMTEQGVASQYYAGTFPAAIPAGTYNLTAKKQAGGSPAESDPTVGVGEINWDGSRVIPISDLANSGQIGQFAPLRIARGVMVQNFPFKLVSDADNKTPFLSGIVSGQISRDGGSFQALQSGLVTEIGLGHYKVNLTSGDLNANTASLVLNANGVSGGRAAQRDFVFVLQRVSGSP